MQNKYDDEGPRYYMQQQFEDRSVAVRVTADEPWTVLRTPPFNGAAGSQAKAFADRQNLFIGPWLGAKEAA